MNAQQKFDYALVMGAVFCTPFNIAILGDKEHECSLEHGQAQIRPTGNGLFKVQIPSGLGFYRSFLVTGPKDLPDLVYDQKTLFGGGGASYAKCAVFAAGIGGYVDGKWLGDSGSLILGIAPGHLVRFVCDHDLVKYWHATGNIESLRNANLDLSTPVDDVEDEDEE